MSTTPPDLGAIIPSALARQVVYGVYVAAAVVIGGFAAYFLGIQEAFPQWLTGGQAVVAYLAIPVGGLALANVQKSAVVTSA